MKVKSNQDRVCSCFCSCSCKNKVIFLISLLLFSILWHLVPLTSTLIVCVCCNIVTITPFYLPPPSLFSGFPFPSPSTWICAVGLFVLLLLRFFHAVMEMATCSHTDLWTESWGSRGNAVLPSHQLVCFPPYATHREWSITILGHLKWGKILHPAVMQ